MTPTPDLFATLSRLEKEHRNLIARVEQLERRRRVSVAGAAGNVLLIVSAGLLCAYLGLLPHGVERLPLRAGSVETGQVILSTPDGAAEARLWVDDKGAHLVDGKGTSLLAKP